MLLERGLVIPVKVNKLGGSVRRLYVTSPGRKFCELYSTQIVKIKAKRSCFKTDFDYSQSYIIQICSKNNLLE